MTPARTWFLPKASYWTTWRYGVLVPRYNRRGHVVSPTWAAILRVSQMVFSPSRASLGPWPCPLPTFPPGAWHQTPRAGLLPVSPYGRTGTVTGPNNNQKIIIKSPK